MILGGVDLCASTLYWSGATAYFTASYLQAQSIIQLYISGPARRPTHPARARWRASDSEKRVPLRNELQLRSVLDRTDAVVEMRFRCSVQLDLWFTSTV